MTTCVGPECDRSDRLINGTYCPGHYRQAKLGKPLTKLRRYDPGPYPCSFEGCDNRVSAHGLCNPHYKQELKGQELAPLGERRPWYATGESPGSITPTGYRILFRPNHSTATKDGKVFEHRMVMADHLGRALLPTEDVHHRNGNKLDNRIENLELWDYRKQPRGQRVVDLLADARRILALYEVVEDKL